MCTDLSGMQMLGKPGGLHAGHCYMPWKGACIGEALWGLQKLSKKMELGGGQLVDLCTRMSQ